MIKTGIVSGNAEEQQTKQQKPKRVPGRPFVKGQSGNPKGRPPIQLSEAERTRRILDEVDPTTGLTWGEQVRRKKIELALAGNIAAIESLENRAYGKTADTLKLEQAEAAPAGYMGVLGVLGVLPPRTEHTIDTTAETVAALTDGQPDAQLADTMAELAKEPVK